MRCDEIFIAGTGMCLPGEESVEEAVNHGRYDRRSAVSTQQIAVTVADAEGESPDFAVAAARQAIERAGCQPEDIGLILHAVTLHAGMDLWNSASYIQRHVASERCLVAEVRSCCDGAFVGLELVCSHLHARAAQPAALVTASDCWPDTVIDRWRTDQDQPFGDGGGAIVLSREHGFARLLATGTATDPELEGMHRGAEAFGPSRARKPIDLNLRCREFLRTMPKEEVLRRRGIGLRAAVDQATAEAGIELADVRRVVVPFVGLRALEREYLKPLGLSLERTTWELGRRIGHTGAADPLIGLHLLVESKRLVRGERTLLVTTGGGFIWTAAVIEVLEGAGP